MPISTRQFVSSTFALVILGIAALFAIIGSSVWLSSRAQDLSDAVLEARDAKSIAVDLRSALQAAESSQRGFLYTDNEVYLSPYDQAKQKAKAAVALLPDALSDYSDLSAAVERLSDVARAKVSEMDESIALKKAREGDKALSLIRTNRGKLQMDEINVFVTGITLAADDRLAELVNEQTGNAVWLQLVSAVNGAIMLALAGGAIYIVIRYTRELKNTQRELSRSNDKLEQRVTERTAELAVATDQMRAAKDRAEVLLAEVNHRVANSLTLVSSLITLQARTLTDDHAKSALEETKARVQAIAMVHRRLYEAGDGQEVALDEYLIGLLDQFKMTAASSNAISFKYEFEPMKLRTDASVNLGVIVSEWVMNAVKYAYPDQAGEIRVVLARQGNGFGILTVEDDGIGRREGSPAQGTGLGTRIVNAMASSMGATIVYLTRSPGTSASLSFPTAPS
ncbi:CHASE3 domain-containing protein (plasmid) [Rhizobium sp. 32-5/1]|uniref:sensor histidine kinase n=1 Tax=Rhizobium sp. 32-5/1 TaxID=3019602 RepID=UPI00240D998E|nr:CHASE3 domain-containing protein [Rhizobium sp. 32-5/1]WEZ85549.1 CHASE3 domain-containing protein [Rhizobium sp. 32-5/1]